MSHSRWWNNTCMIFKKRVRHVICGDDIWWYQSAKHRFLRSKVIPNFSRKTHTVNAHTCGRSFCSTLICIWYVGLKICCVPSFSSYIEDLGLTMKHDTEIFCGTLIVINKTMMVQIFLYDVKYFQTDARLLQHLTCNYGRTKLLGSKMLHHRLAIWYQRRLLKYLEICGTADEASKVAGPPAIMWMSVRTKVKTRWNNVHFMLAFS